ncbi:unnamed protein product [Alopecurus aequalis]
MHVTIAMAYSTTPDRLLRRFPRLESLKIKGKPRAAMFPNIIPENWGGSASPWIRELSASFPCLKALHLRRMVVSDDDLAVLVHAKASILVSLKLDLCSGFSTPSLALIARSCKKLEVFFVEGCSIGEKENGEWIRELATSGNTVLETLDFFETDISASPADLALLVRNCARLKTLRIGDCCVMSDLIDLFRSTETMQVFAGGSFDEQNQGYEGYCFPPSIWRLSLLFMRTNEMHILFPYAAALNMLDLQYTFLSTEHHCQLLRRCPNLQALVVRDVIGDRGLQVVAQTCKHLQRLRVERGYGAHGFPEEEHGCVTQVGLMAVAQGCPGLQYLAVHVSDITNAALEAIGMHSKKLNDFRIVLLGTGPLMIESPLDNGVRELLRGCTKLRRFAFYVRPGALSDLGLSYVGEFSNTVRYMLLGNVGASDDGLLEFARGCPSLQKLELRGCCFSGHAIAVAALQLKSLRYLWVQAYNASPTGTDLMAMARPFWNIEFTPPDQDPKGHAQVLAYYSLAGARTDRPQSVISLNPLV